MTQQEVRSAFDKKDRRGIFNPSAHHVTNLADREDRLWDGIAQTYEMFERYAMEKGKVEVYRLAGLLDDDGDFVAQDEAEALFPGLATALQVNPQRDIIGAVDLEAWAASLPDADQELLAMRQAGSTLANIVEHLDVSVSKVFSRMKLLGLILAARAVRPVAGTTPSVA